MKDEDLVRHIFAAAYEVRKSLAPGYYETVYRNALAYELVSHGIKCETEVQIPVTYKGISVGNYRADILVDDHIIIEIKACNSITLQHEIQLVNYLTATKIDLGLLINFGEQYGIRRKIRIYEQKEQ